MATRKWIPIVVGIVIFVVLVGGGLVVGAAYFVSQQMKVQQMTATDGQAEFDRLVAGLAGQTPFIELPDGDVNGEAVVHRELETRPTGSISTVHMRVWSERERTLVRVDLPFWIMRLGGNHPVRFRSGPGEDIALRVSPEEIDKRGPGLILKHSNDRGEHVLVWTE
jgi:hypothetical protein